MRILFFSATFNATQGVDPGRSAPWLNTVDQGCSAQVREVATCGAQTVSRSSTSVGTSKAREMASTTSVSEGESRYLHARSKATCVSVGSSVGSFRRYEKPGGHNVAGVSEVGTACCSGTSSGCSVGTMRTVCCPGSEAAGFTRRGTSQIGFRVGGGPGTIATAACRSFSETSRTKCNSASTTTALGSRASTVAISRGTDAAREDSIGCAAREDPIGSKTSRGRAPGSPVGGRRSPARAGFSCCRERRFCRAGHHHGRGGFEFNLFRPDSGIDRRRGVEVASDGSHPHQWMTLRGARYGLRGVRVGEASHPGPPKNLLRLRRASSTRPEPRDVSDFRRWFHGWRQR